MASGLLSFTGFCILLDVDGLVKDDVLTEAVYKKAKLVTSKSRNDKYSESLKKFLFFFIERACKGTFAGLQFVTNLKDFVINSSKFSEIFQKICSVELM